MGDERDELLRRLRGAGLDDAAIARAERDGRLPTVAVELALGAEQRHTLTAVARASGLPPAYLRELLQAVGRASPERGERAFSDDDVELALLIRGLVDAGLPRREVLEAARVLGQGMSQFAESVRRLVGDALLHPGDSEQAVGLRYAQAADGLGPLAARMLDLVFRAHLRDGIRGQLISEAERQAGRLADTRDVAVAFADLVDYTRLGERLPAEAVGRIAGRFAALSTRAVCRPAQLVKTIGDAAMFVSPDAGALVETLVALRAGVDAAQPELPTVRIGAAHGPATARGGDWFGSSVNRASRICDVAKPGQILASEELATRTAGQPWKRRRLRRGFKGIEGRVRLYVLEAPPVERAD